jgi:lipopolysaccharide transport system permease protein
MSNPNIDMQEAVVSSTAELIDEERPAVVSAEAPSADEPLDDLPVTIIEPKPGWRFLDLNELWRYRELLYFLTWRDIKVRYKQTVLGAAWAVLQPFATMVVFTMFLGKVAGIDTGATPYPLFVFAGLLTWTFFANAVSTAGQSIVGNQNLVTKVYFPRLIIPMSAVGVGLVDFLIAFGMLVILMIYFGAAFSWTILLTPAIFLLLAIAALGVGTLLAALTVAYRDFRYVVPFGVQLWMFATPTIYMPVDDLVGPRGQMLLPLNPAYGLIYNFRQAMLGGTIDLYSLTVSASVGLAMLVLGCMYFRRVERSFADII